MLDQKKVNVALEGLISLVLRRFNKIKGEMKENFDEEMSLVASQGLWDGESYEGYYPELRNLILAGGMSGNVLQNILYHLGIPVSSSLSDRPDLPFLFDLYPYILKGAMSRSKDLDLFIRSFISGAEKVGVNFNDYREESLKKCFLS